MLRRFGWPEADVLTEIKARFGPVTDAESELQSRIAREVRIFNAAMTHPSGPRFGARVLFNRLQRLTPLDAPVVYLRDLNEEQMAEIELWVHSARSGVQYRGGAGYASFN